MFRLVNRYNSYLNMSPARDRTILLAELTCLYPSQPDHNSYNCLLNNAGIDLRNDGMLLRNYLTGLWIAGTDLLFPGTSLWIARDDLWIIGTDLWVTGTILWIAGNNLWITGTVLKITGTNLWFIGTDHQSLHRTFNNK